MAEFYPSIAIALGNYPSSINYATRDPNFRRPNPLGYRENLLAMRGLDRHMREIHREKMEKYQDPEGAMLSVFELFGDVDRYRKRTQDIIDALEAGPRLEAFPLVVPAIATAKMSAVSRSTGKWPPAREYEALRVGLQEKLLAETGFGKLLAWSDARRLSLDHSRFLLHQLASVGEHPFVRKIGELVDESKPIEDPVEETIEV